MSPIELVTSVASQKALDKLEAQGLSVTKHYGYDAPSLPKDITGLDDEDLMDLYTKYVAYLEFINLQAWCAQADKSESEKDMVLERARKKLELKASGKAVALLDAEVEVDNVYREKVDAFREISNYHGLLEIMSDKLSKDISLINREITRRVNINKMAGRSSWLAP
jgi:hypothetical protein